jgi:hypothetical protein
VTTRTTFLAPILSIALAAAVALALTKAGNAEMTGNLSIWLQRSSAFPRQKMQLQR